MAFLARGLHPNWKHAFQRFVRSYQNFPAGIAHRLYVIFKGYRDADHLAEGESYFAALPHTPIHTHDAGFGIGCYQRVAHEMQEELICFLNTKSEILCPNWLRHLADQLMKPGVGLVGNTGSYESLHHQFPEISPFPNPHIRTNAFLIQRERFCRIADQFEMHTQKEGWMFECGPNGLSQQVRREGLELRVVDRAGNGYGPERWKESRTYCTPGAAPLIGDDTYRAYLASNAVGKKEMAITMWGPAAEEVRVRELQRRREELKRRRASLDRSLRGRLFRLSKRLVRLCTSEAQYQSLKRLSRGRSQTERSPA